MISRVRRWWAFLREDSGFRAVLIVFLASRLALEVVGWVAGLRVPGGRPPQKFGIPDAPAFLDMWIRWDSQWYLAIAERGYWLRPDGLPMPQAFFPLYPLLVRVLSAATGLSLEAAGLLLANAGFLLGLAAFYRLVEAGWGGDAAVRAGAYLVLFPAGFYFSALYTEGLYFAFVAGAFLFASRDRWREAGLCGMGAALTRNGGVLLAAALAVAYLARRGFSPRRIRRDALWLGLVPAGLVLYMAYLAATTGDPLAYVDAEHRWGRALHPPWVGVAQAVGNIVEPPPPQAGSPHVYHSAYRPPYRRLYSTLDLAAAGLFAFLAVYGVRRRWLPPGEAVFLAASLLTALSAPALQPMTPLPSMWRSVAVLFPGFTVLALLAAERPAVDQVVRVAFPVLQGLFFLLYTTWNWIA